MWFAVLGVLSLFVSRLCDWLCFCSLIIHFRFNNWLSCFCLFSMLVLFRRMRCRCLRDARWLRRLYSGRLLQRLPVMVSCGHVQCASRPVELCQVDHSCCCRAFIDGCLAADQEPGSRKRARQRAIVVLLVRNRVRVFFFQNAPFSC